jgi:hypothetical protein
MRCSMSAIVKCPFFPPFLSLALPRACLALVTIRLSPMTVWRPAPSGHRDVALSGVLRIAPGLPYLMPGQPATWVLETART